MNETEQFKEAFAVLAAEAPDIQPVATVLARQRRVASQRRTVLRLAGVGAAAVAVGGGAVAFARLAERRPAPLPAVEPQGNTVALHTRLTWLPEDYTPSVFEATVGGPAYPAELRRLFTARTWRTNAGGEVTLTEFTAPQVPPPAGATTVDLGGTPALQADGTDGTTLTWQPSGGPIVQLVARKGGDVDPAVDRPLGVRIAQALTVTPAGIAVPRLDRLSAGSDGAHWMTAFLVWPDGSGDWRLGPVGPQESVLVDLAPHPVNATADPVAQTVQVRGRDGYVTRSGALAVHLADGRWITVYQTAEVGAPLTFAAARHLAEGLRLAPPLDLTAF